MQAMIQKKHIIAQISDRSQVMGNENISQPQFFFQIMEQIHDLNLSMGIQRRDSFVKKNDLWLAGYSPGNAYTLQLSAGQLMGIPVCIGGIQPNKL